MRPFADDAGNGVSGVPWLSGPLLHRSALDTLGPQVARLIQTSYLVRPTMLQIESTHSEPRLSALGDLHA